MLPADTRSPEDSVAALQDAATIQEALARLQTVQPDLMLLDVLLPKLDGWGVLTAVRASSRLPVILLTSLDDVDDVMQEVSVAALRKFSTLDDHSAFGAWACLIARYELLSARRRFARPCWRAGPSNRTPGPAANAWPAASRS